MPQSGNLYVGNFPKNWTDSQLLQLFEAFGPITTHKVMMESGGAQSKGFGFVNFAEEEHAKAAVNAMNGFELEGHPLTVKFADNSPGAPGGKKHGQGGFNDPMTFFGDVPAAPQAPQPTPNLYCKGLPTSWTEADVNTFFGTHGNVMSACILKDKNTGASRGVAMVRYSDVGTAQGVIDLLNGQVAIEGHSQFLEIRFAESGPKKPAGGFSLPGGRPPPAAAFHPYGMGAAAPQPGHGGFSQQLPMLPPMSSFGGALGNGFGQVGALQPQMSDRNLYCKGLPLVWTEEEVNAFFAQFGTLKSAVVLRDKMTNQSRGIAMVRYSEAASAMAAVQGLNGQTVEGSNRPLEVKFATQKDRAGEAVMDRNHGGGVPQNVAPAVPTSNGQVSYEIIYVGGIPPVWTETELNVFFGTFGTVVSSVIVRDPATQLSTGTAIVRYTDSNAAISVYQSLTGQVAQGSAVPLEIRFSDHSLEAEAFLQPNLAAGGAAMAPQMQHMQSSTPGGQPSNNIFARGVPIGWTEAEADAFFQQYGKVLSSVILKDKVTGKSRGIAMIRFDDTATATRVIQQLNGQQIEGVPRTLEVKFANK